MRTPEQIAEDMRREIDRERQLHGTMYNEGSAVLGAVARAIARECARAKLEAVEPNPGAELRSDGARHSDCTNCGGQSATGGVFTPCEACGSTGDRVVQLEREAAALRALPMQNTFEPICRNCVNTGVGHGRSVQLQGSAMTRAPGFYWVQFKPLTGNEGPMASLYQASREWIIVQLETDGSVYALGTDIGYDVDCIEMWGPKIEPPALTDPGALAETASMREHIESSVAEAFDGIEFDVTVDTSLGKKPPS